MECASGYTLTEREAGAGLMTECLDGTLLAPTCEASTCHLDKPEFGMYGDCIDEMDHASSCSISCLAGYNASIPLTTCSYGKAVKQTCVPSPCIFDVDQVGAFLAPARRITVRTRRLSCNRAPNARPRARLDSI